MYSIPLHLLLLLRVHGVPLNLNPRYDGHIILGTRRDLSPRESNFLAAQHVTTVAVDLAECEGSAAPSNG